MFRNHIKIALRMTSRNKIYALINVAGLALGICACIVIFLVASYDFSFDKFHPDKERIYRVVGEAQNGANERQFLNCPISFVAGLQTQIPGFESSAGFHFYDGRIGIPDGTRPAKKFDNQIPGSWQSSTIITWPQYFEIFKYQWLAGKPEVLNEPNKMVLSEKRARQYFGPIPLDQIMGKTVVFDDSLKVTVGGIVKDWDQNTDFGFTDFISISTATHSFLKSWIPTEDWSSLQPHNAQAFVKLVPGTTAAQINQRFAVFVNKIKFPDPAIHLTMRLQALNDIHFTTELHRTDDGDNFRKPYMPTLYILMSVALFILIIATVNFINLSTAQSIRRAKEIGVRKVMGSSKKNIVFQFLTETFVLALFSVILAVVLVGPVLHLFREYFPEGVRFHPTDGSTLLFLFLITVVTTLLAGFYPGRVLAGYLPVLSLKGGLAMQAGKTVNFRKGLIVFQFVISLFFIISAMIIGKQIHFMEKADKGFDSDAVLVVNHWRDKGKLKIYARQIAQIAGVKAVILQGNSPMGFAHGSQEFVYKGKTEDKRIVNFDEGGEDFIPFYGMKLLAGRDIRHSDSLNELVINEAYSRVLGFPDPRSALGVLLYSNGSPHAVVGVVADYHQGSFHQAIGPAAIGEYADRQYSVAAKLDAGEKKFGELRPTILEMEGQWKKLFPNDRFDPGLLSELIARLYGEDQQTAWLVNIAMSITIFISCMGLFGLGMFTAQRRTKEIGIRKVLGASVANIMTMLSREFVVLVVLALVIASPVAGYFMHRWLQDFAYRIDINWWIFALAGLVAIMISLATIAFQAIKAATANPVKNLRTE
jgi:putative ABC transport system permease protein